LTELKSLLLQWDELVIDLKNIMYRHEDAVEKLTKIKADADKQMVNDMKQIRELSQQLADHEVAAKVVIDMVEDEGAGEKSLLERLCEAPQRLSSFFSDTSREYLAHALGLVKSFLPSANLSPIGDGVAVGCSEEKFFEYALVFCNIMNKIRKRTDTAIALTQEYSRVSYPLRNVSTLSTGLGSLALSTKLRLSTPA
jgi:hypothetical protein